MSELCLTIRQHDTCICRQRVQRSSAAFLFQGLEVVSGSRERSTPQWQLFTHSLLCTGSDCISPCRDTLIQMSLAAGHCVCTATVAASLSITEIRGFEYGPLFLIQQGQYSCSPVLQPCRVVRMRILVSRLRVLCVVLADCDRCRSPEESSAGPASTAGVLFSIREAQGQCSLPLENRRSQNYATTRL